jgi:hypothetical protein
MSECLRDCWICQKNKTKCTLQNNCVVLNGNDCEMKDVCNPKRIKCPLNNGQAELFNLSGGHY